jgi:large subunit ribosomal protein L27e
MSAEKQEKKQQTKFIRQGRIVIILAGRYAGKKAVVVQNFDEGNKERPFGHALVAGIDKAPLKVTKTMSKKKIQKRSRVKPFIKFVNYNHIMPTRYTLPNVDVKTVVNPNVMKKSETRVDARKEVKKLFEKRYITRDQKTQNGAQFFYAKLRF